jgi:hypothetical protein
MAVMSPSMGPSMGPYLGYIRVSLRMANLSFWVSIAEGEPAGQEG